MNDEIIIHQHELDKQPEVKSPSPWPSRLKKIGIALAIILLAAGIFVVINLFKVSVNPFGFGHLKGESDGRVNILMLGVGDPGHAGENLTDTNIILSVNTRTHQVATIGVPRDLRVRLHGDGYAKVNTAYSSGGIDGAKKTFEDSFGLPIHYYVKANFTGLKEVVDAVGGVDIDNQYALSDPEYPCDKNENRSCGFRLTAGQHHLDGATALKYVRCRKGTCGDDFGRAERQQQVMQSIRDHATSAGTLANPLALGRLVAAAGSNIKTDLSINNLQRLNELTKGGDVIRVVFNLQPDGFLTTSGSSDLVPAGGDFDDIQEFVKNIFVVGPIWSEHPTVMIENGTTTPGIGAKFQQKLKSDGYDISVTAVTNALTKDFATSKIIDYTNGAKNHTKGYLLNLLGLKEVSAPEKPTKYPPADFVIILGSDYAASSTSTKSNQ
ncbi:MAG TPA: LCP family protein [Candidatus Saccharimonadales bacterium]|nr:LCP family protein [Candidatus Saccharimonadales bacterium]